jgi:hypothetical protein
MKVDVSKQIAGLHGLPRADLAALWQRLFKKPAPPGIRREFLVPFLAYKIQENAYGGLGPRSRAELRRIAKEVENSHGSSGHPNRAQMRTGMRLLREWRGEMHEVLVTESGYEYRGINYRSLSELARKITGTRWSGPAFFKLDRATSEAKNGND